MDDNVRLPDGSNECRNISWRERHRKNSAERSDGFDKYTVTRKAARRSGAASYKNGIRDPRLWVLYKTGYNRGYAPFDIRPINLVSMKNAQKNYHIRCLKEQSCIGDSYRIGVVESMVLRLVQEAASVVQKIEIHATERRRRLPIPALLAFSPSPNNILTSTGAKMQPSRLLPRSWQSLHGL